MAYLINRNPPARLQCLHSLCKFVNDTIGKQIFKMNDIKYDPNSTNIHSYCSLIVNDENLKIRYCPFKENPLSQSGCSLTNGVLEDTTKSKEVSNTVNALEALGFINRNNNDLVITDDGILFSNTDYFSENMNTILIKAVLNYGVFVGFLAQIISLSKDTFKTNEIYIGYPNTNEKLTKDGSSVLISAGSQADSNTRTKSCLLAWATTLGFISPKKLLGRPRLINEYVLSKHRCLSEYVRNVTSVFFSARFVTNNPMDYDNLTKNTRALRENNQKLIRVTTMEVEPIIKNRRYAILSALNNSFKGHKSLNLKILIDYLRLRPDLFVIDNNSFERVMYDEIQIAFMAGIPYLIDSNHDLKPLTGLNQKVLDKGCPIEVKQYMRIFDNE